MAYVLLLVVAGTWAFLALRDRPLVQYAHIFFISALLAIPAEVATLRLLNLYEWRMHLLGNPEADKMLGSIVIAWLNPLLGVLYTRYCHPRPTLTAFLASTVLGLTEALLANTGFMAYRFWSPLFTTGLFFFYFLALWRISLQVTRLPVWSHLLGFIMWLSLITDIPLQGIWWLWHFQITLFGDMVRDNRLFSSFPIFMILTPSVLAASLAKARQQLLWAIAAISFLLLIEAAALATGLLVYDHWSLGWSTVRYTGIISASVAYTRWVHSQQLAVPE